MTQNFNPNLLRQQVCHHPQSWRTSGVLRAEQRQPPHLVHRSLLPHLRHVRGKHVRRRSSRGHRQGLDGHDKAMSEAVGLILFKADLHLGHPTHVDRYLKLRDFSLAGSGSHKERRLGIRGLWNKTTKNLPKITLRLIHARHSGLHFLQWTVSMQR